MSEINKYNNYRDTIVQDWNNNRSNIDAMTILKFLKGDKIKVIPKYQRPYSWGEDEINTLFEDIENIIENKKNNWFIGPLFTTQKRNESNIDEIEILDGQQRITSIIMLLRVLYSIEFSTTIWLWNNSINQAEKKEHKDRYNYYKKAIEDCLIISTMVKNQVKNNSKFETDLSSKKEFSNWIIGIKEIDNKNYNKKKSLVSTSSSKFSATKTRINKNLNIIYEKLEKEADKENGLIYINSFLDCILDKFYIINVPLYKSESVLEIFESLNNRGKPLNLVDLIRFRTIIDDSQNKLEIEEIWHDIFGLHDDLTKVGLFSKGINDFFEKYINSLTEDATGYTKDNKRLKRFVDNYKNNAGCLKELKKVKLTLNLFKCFFCLNESGSNNFSEKFSSVEKIRVKSILTVLKYAIQCSDNAVVTFCSFLRNKIDSYDFFMSSQGDSVRKITVNFFFEFIKFIISKDIYQKIDSNERRNIYYRIALRLRENDLVPIEIYNELSKFERLENFDGKYFENIIRISNEKYTKLILHYVQLLHNFSDINAPHNFIPNYDHIVPQKWYGWEQWKKFITEQNLNNIINEISNSEYKITFKEMLEKYNLWNNSDSKNSFIQLIGNGWYIHRADNIKAQNFPWKDYYYGSLPNKKNYSNPKEGKLKIYKNFQSRQNQNYFIPTIYNPTEHSEFGIKHIIERTIVLYEIIKDNSDKKWNSL